MCILVLSIPNRESHWDFPGSPVVKTWHLQYTEGTGLITGWGTKIPHASLCGQKRKKKKKKIETLTVLCNFICLTSVLSPNQISQFPNAPFALSLNIVTINWFSISHYGYPVKLLWFKVVWNSSVCDYTTNSLCR